MGDRVSRFFALFRGSPRGHGRYEVNRAGSNGGKVEGQRWTAHEPPTVEVFSKHLDGSLGLGAVPLLLDPPGTTLWAAIDIDDYSLDLTVFVRLVVVLQLPVVLCRTKSGGVHVYVFFRVPVSTKLVTSHLRVWARALGYPEAEIFPKQLFLGNDESSESYWGNWINLPYQGGDRSTRYALNDAGEALTTDEFLDRAESRLLTETDLVGFELPPAAPDARFEGAPPCVCRMADVKVTSGGRNNALFQVALFYKLADPTHVQQLVETYNKTYLVPPLPAVEVMTIVRAAQKKNYSYRCKEFPMVSLCDRTTCEQLEFGVRHGKGELGSELGLALGRLIKIATHPPIWRWEVNGEWVELTTDEFLTQKLFLKRVLEDVNARSRPVKPRAWEQLLDDAVAHCTIEVPPPDATAVGQLRFHLNRFCTGRAQAKTIDELLLAKPFTDPVEKRTYFVVSDLLVYLSQQRVTGMSEKWVYSKLRDLDLQAHDAVLKGKQVAYWSLPAQSVQTLAFDPPREEVAAL